MCSHIRITHICRQEDQCNGAENSKPDHNEEAVKIKNSNEKEEEEGKSDAHKSLHKQGNLVSDTAETHPVNAISESVPLEMPESVVKLHVRHSSRSKHHKSKTRHHKDKRKKRRHSRNGNEDTCAGSQESERISENASDAQNDSVESKDPSNCQMAGSESNAKSKLGVESSGINRSKDVESATTKTDVGSVRFISDVNNTSSDNTRCNAKATNGAPSKSVRDTLEDKTVNLQFSDATASVPKRACNAEVSNKDIEYSNPAFPIDDLAEAQVADAQIADVQVADESEKKSKTSVTHNVESQKHKNATSDNASKNGESKDAENRKLKKKRKRPRHDAQVREKNVANDTAKNNTPDETALKHRRKKHKHTNDHRTKKYHDVRKAPQDGIIKEENHAQDVQPPEGESESSTSGSAKTDEEAKETDVMTEPQRLAIKIKLCQECNSRHLQDTCPLTMPQYTIVDAITYDQWLNKHKKNTEMMKAVRTVDPMSEGYGRPTDDNFESDDESLTSGEQCKSKSKVQREEKQLVVDADRPLYARDSLPNCFELKIANSDHGLGIYAKEPVPMYSKLGPLIGTPVREMDIPDDFSMRHIWEVLSFL